MNPISLSYSTNGGTSWTSIASNLANSGSYSWTAPSLNSQTVLVKMTAVDAAGNTASAQSSSNLTIDSTPPTVSLTSLTGGQIIAGGSTQAITWSASDNYSLAANPISLSYSTDGGTSWTSIVSNLANSGSYSWTVPSVNSQTVLVKMTAVDAAGNTASAQSSSNLTIDSTPPTVSLTSLTGGQSIAGGSTQAITWTASDNYALAANPIGLSYSTDGGTSWTSIVSNLANSGSYSWTVPSVNSQTVLVKMSAVDAAGNTASAQSSSNLTIDSTSPTVSLTSLTGGQIIAGGSTQAITWSASDNYSLAANPISLSYSTDGGTSWTSIASNLANSGSYSWTVPSVNSQTVLVKMTAVDAAGNTASAQSSSNLTIDSTPPTVNSLSVNGTTSGGTTADNYVQISMSITDNLTNITYLCLKSNSSAAPNASNSCWIPVNLAGIAASTSETVTNYPFLLGFTPGVYTIYAWAKDQAGNISSLSNAGNGTIGTDSASITYNPGSPATLVNVEATSSATPLYRPLPPTLRSQPETTSTCNGISPRRRTVLGRLRYRFI